MCGHEAKIMELQALMKVWRGEMTCIQCTRAPLSDQHAVGASMKRERKNTHEDGSQDAVRLDKTAVATGGCTRCKTLLAREDNIHKDLLDQDFDCDHRVYAAVAAVVVVAGAVADPWLESWTGRGCQMKSGRS